MKIQTESPELSEVPGAVRATVEITKVPCGDCYTTAFYDAAGVVLRQDQHVVVDRKWLSMQGTASL